MKQNKVVIFFLGTLLASIIIANIISYENKAKNNRQLAIASQNAVANEKEKPNSTKTADDSKNTDCKNKKCIALTFDDGPSKYSNEILDILKSNNAKASFFYIGAHLSSHVNEIKRTSTEGHDIGNHTWDHINLNKIPDTQLQDQINRTNDEIARITGQKPVLLRPPFGSLSSNRFSLIGKMSVVQWSVDPDDWKDKDANVIYDRVMQAVANGNIVISHEIYQSSIDAYKRIIPDLIKQGYSLVTITDMFDIDPTDPPLKAYYSTNKIL